MFQEVTSNLPREDRVELAELIQSIQLSKSKKSIAKRWSGTLPQMNQKNRISPKDEGIQKYTPKEESAGIRISNSSGSSNGTNKETINFDYSGHRNSLIGTCRAVRIKEDNTVYFLHDSFKVKSLLNKSESFKF